MAYVDYKTATQLAGTVTSITNRPDHPASWITNGENAEQTITNRPHQHLAENADILKDRLDEQKALVQIADITSFTGPSLTIDPDAGTGSDIDFATAGYLYVGNSDYSGATQDDFDSLFHFMDEYDNDVVFGGEQVKITAIAPGGAALGNGFFNGAIVTLTVGTDSTPAGVTLPSGNYRLRYARDTTLATMPNDALIKSEIRSAHDAPYQMSTLKGLTQQSLLSLSGSSLVINPDGTGGGGVHINYATPGYLYVGNSNYSGGTQYDFDALFQIMDSNGNELMFEGEEVKITAISGTTLGSGFVNGGLITLTLGTDSTPGGVSLPTAWYYLKYARETTLKNLPDDALIAAEIRGGHEGSGENQRPMWAVCTLTGYGDYVGASAFEDAVANGEKRIYLKAGTYGPITANTSLAAVEYIMGEGVDVVTIEIDGNYNITNMPSSEGFSFEVVSTPANNNHVTLADGAIIRNVKFKSLKLFLNSNVVLENSQCGGYDGGFEVPASSYNVSVTNLLYDASDHTSDQFFDIREGCRNLRFDNIRPVTIGSNLSTVPEPLLYFEGVTVSKDVKFTNCYFETSDYRTFQPGNDVSYIVFENCVFENNSATYATVYLASVNNLTLDSCRIEQLSTSATLGNEAIFCTNSNWVIMRNCEVTNNSDRQAMEVSSLDNSRIENCDFTTSSANYAAVEFASGSSRRNTIANCEFRQSSSTSAGTNPCLLLTGSLDRSKIDGCYFYSNSDYAFKASTGLDGLSINDCYFDSNKTVFDLGASLNDNLVSIRNCIMKNTATAWYNERFIRIKSYTASEYPLTVNRPSSGVYIENLHLEDEWCLGHDSPSSPPTITDGTAGFPVVDLMGVSGSNLSFDREDLDYNVENGAWLSMENCCIDSVAVHVDEAAPMTPHTYTAGTVSDGIIEVKGVSVIRGLRYGVKLTGEVSRSVVWVQSTSDMDDTDDMASCRQAVVEGLQVGFDDGTASFDSPNEEGIALTLAGNARVSGFVWNADCKVEEHEVVGTVPKTESIVRLRGNYNVLERAFIRHDCSTQGSVYSLICSGDVGDYGNKVMDCVIKSKLDIPPDDGSFEYPRYLVELHSGSSGLVSGCDMFIEGSPTTGSFFAFVMATGANNYRVADNSMVINGSLDNHSDGDVISAVDSTLISPAGAAVGNTVVARQGTTAPGVDAAVDVGNRKLLDTTTSNYPSL